LITLNQLFLQYSVGGVLSSIPWNELNPKYRGCLNGQNWNYGLYYRGREASKKAFFEMGINYLTQVPHYQEKKQRL
jgi:hypothetical protein